MGLGTGNVGECSKWAATSDKRSERIEPSLWFAGGKRLKHLIQEVSGPNCGRGEIRGLLRAKAMKLTVENGKSKRFGTQRISLFAQHQVERPASANVRTRFSQVVEKVFVVAPSILKRIGQNRSPVERLLLVNTLGKQFHV